MAVRRDGNQSGKKRKPRYKGIPSPAASEKAGSQKAINKTTVKRSAPKRSGSIVERAADVALDVAERHPKPKVRKAVRKGRKEGRAIKRRRREMEPLRDLVEEAGRDALTRPFAKHLKEYRRVTRNMEDPDTKINLGPLGKLNIEAELEGRGGIAKAAETAKKVVSSSAAQKGFRAAGLPVPEGKLGKAALKDLVDIPAQAIPSAYAVGAGVKEAVQGRPQRIEKLGKDFKEHSPVALVAQGRLKEAAKEAEKHPVLTGLEVSGVGSVASRAVGASVRGSGAALRKAPTKRGRKVGKRLRKIGTTKRAPRVLPGTNIRENRVYSKGILGKATQVAVERTQRRSAKKLKAKAKRTRDPQRKIELRQAAAAKDPRMVRPKEITRRVDEREAMAEVRRRAHRGEATKKAAKALPKNRADVALLLAQRTIKPTRESLAKFKRDIDTQIKSGNLSKSQVLAAKKIRRQLDSALRDKKLDFDALQKAADEYVKVVRPMQKELVGRGIIAPEQERMAKLVPYAVREMGAKFDRKADVFRDKRGNEIPVTAVEAHMRRNGIDPDDVAYVTQAPGQSGARNFFSSWHEPKGATTGRRTGEATRKGAFELTRETGRENVARQQGLIDAHNEYAEFVGENAFRRGGKIPREFGDRKAAVEFARDNLGDSPYEWRPVPTRPLFGRKDQSLSLLDQADAQDVGLTTGVREGIEKALAGEGDGKYVLVPAVAADRLSKHSRLLGSSGTKLTRKVGRQFSGTVLTTSGFTWPVGNVVEASLRAAINRAGPSSLALGRKTVKELRKLDPKKAEELEARIGTGVGGAFELNNIHSTARVFQGTVFAPVARVTGAFFRIPGPKQVAQVWNGWTKAIFGGNGFIEHQFRTAQMGRHLRDQGYSPKKLALTEGTKAMSKAAEQAAQGLRGTNEQIAAARFVRRAYGQYEAWSPEMRFTIAVFTPFAAWSLNAVKFMVDVLPRDHPVLTGLVASAERASEEWRNQMGLGKFIDGAAPNWMQASIPVDGKLLPVGRYTPFGFWADPLEQGGSLLLPQINGLVLASKGLDWKGDPIAGYERSDDVSEGARAKEIARVAAGSFVPFFGLSERVREKGKGAFSPVKGYDYDKKTSAAFDQLERVKKAKDAIKTKHPNVSADDPTPEYERLHRKERELNERIYKFSKGKYGNQYKEPYEPSGSSGSTSSGGSGWDQYREGGAPKQKSGWDAYR